MGREIVEPTVDERGYETHPAWGMISVHRSQVGGGPAGGAVLFDSDIAHHHVITVRLHEASRKRDLNSDHKMPGAILSEVTFSESQWAAFIASTNQGSGVPCTINRRESGQMPEMPYTPRIQESLAEVRGAAEHAMKLIRDAYEKVVERPNKGNIKHLGHMIDNAPSNMTFAVKSLAKSAEKVVDHAKADLEAFVTDRAAQLGVEPGELGVPQLPAHDDEGQGD